MKFNPVCLRSDFLHETGGQTLPHVLSWSFSLDGHQGDSS